MNYHKNSFKSAFKSNYPEILLFKVSVIMIRLVAFSPLTPSKYEISLHNHFSYLAIVNAIRLSCSQVTVFCLRKSWSEPNSWNSVINQYSVTWESPCFSAAMNRNILSWFIRGSLYISCSVNHDCFSWIHKKWRIQNYYLKIYHQFQWHFLCKKNKKC